MSMITPESIILELSDKETLLLKEITVRDEKIINLDQENHRLKEQLAWFKRQIFGNGILTADLPDSLLPRCRADESLLALA